MTAKKTKKRAKRVYFDRAAFGKKLLELRNAVEFSVRDMAEEIGIDHSTYHRAERGKSCCIDNLARLADFAGVRLDDFVKTAITIED